jgi:serine/threonine protein kinase
MGAVHVDFLDRVSLAERRDEERSRQTVAATPLVLPPRKGSTPKSAKKKKTWTGGRRAGAAPRSPSSPVKKKRAAAAAAKLAAEKAMKEKRALSKPAAIDPGRELAQHGYEPLGPIAAGAFSTILRARDSSTGAEVAVKTFDNAKCGKAAVLAEARDLELKALRLLAAHAAGEGGGGGRGCHPHIANLLAEHTGPNCTHAVLEYCTGGSLQRHLQLLQKSRAPARGAAAGSHAGSASDGIGMPEPQVLVLTWQVASALEHLHSLEVAHRDLKPGNILFDGPLGAAEPQMRVKLCDFGFALKCGRRMLKRQLGTPTYLAPELTIPPDAHDGYRGRPVDMWALGCVVYEALHGKACFYGASLEQLETRIRSVSHEAFAKETSSGPRQLIHALLTHDPEKRPSAKGALDHIWLRRAAKQQLLQQEEWQQRQQQRQQQQQQQQQQQHIGGSYHADDLPSSADSHTADEAAGVTDMAVDVTDIVDSRGYVQAPMA